MLRLCAGEGYVWGFYLADCTPVTKCLIGCTFLGTMAFNIPLREYQYWFQYSYDTVFMEKDVSINSFCHDTFAYTLYVRECINIFCEFINIHEQFSNET